MVYILKKIFNNQHINSENLLILICGVLFGGDVAEDVVIIIPGDIVKAIIASEIAYRVKKLNLLSENTEPPKPKYFSRSSS